MESLCLSATAFPPVRPIKHVPIATTRKPFIRATICNPVPLTVTYSETSSPPLRRVSPDSLQYEEGYLGAVPAGRVDESREGVVKAMRYLTNILSSKVYDISTESPLQLAQNLSRRLGVQLWLKREDFPPVIVSLINLLYFYHFSWVFVSLGLDCACVFPFLHTVNLLNFLFIFINTWLKGLNCLLIIFY